MESLSLVRKAVISIFPRWSRTVWTRPMRTAHLGQSICGFACYDPTTARTKSQQEAPTREITQEPTGLAMLHSAAPSQEAAGGLNKRSHSRDNREIAIWGKGNYGLTGESRRKASSLYTTTCGYVEQTQSKMGTMTTRHMIGSSVA